MSQNCPDPQCPSRALQGGGFAFAASDIRPADANVFVPEAIGPGYYVYPTEREGATVPVIVNGAVVGFAANASDCSEGVTSNVVNVNVEPVVNNVVVPAPIVNVDAPDVTVTAPTVNVAAPTVNVAAPNVTVTSVPDYVAIGMNCAGDLVRMRSDGNVEVVTDCPDANPAGTYVTAVQDQCDGTSVLHWSNGTQTTVGVACPAEVVEAITYPDGSVVAVRTDGTTLVLVPAPAVAPPVTGTWAPCPLVFPLVYQGAVYEDPESLKRAVDLYAGVTTSYAPATCTFTAPAGTTLPPLTWTAYVAPAAPCASGRISDTQQGFMFVTGDTADAAATVDVLDCTTNAVRGKIYATAGAGHTVPVMACDGTTLLGYAVNKSDCAPDCACVEVVVQNAGGGGIDCAAMSASNPIQLCDNNAEFGGLDPATCAPQRYQVVIPHHDITTVSAPQVTMSGAALDALYQANDTCSTMAADLIYSSTWFRGSLDGVVRYVYDFADTPGIGIPTIHEIPAVTFNAGDVLVWTVQSGIAAWEGQPPLARTGPGVLADDTVNEGWTLVAEEVSNVYQNGTTQTADTGTQRVVTKTFIGVVTQNWTGQMSFRAPYFPMHEDRVYSGWATTLVRVTGADPQAPVAGVYSDATQIAQLMDNGVWCTTPASNDVTYTRNSPCNSLLHIASTRHMYGVNSTDPALTSMTGGTVLENQRGSGQWDCTASLGLMWSGASASPTTFSVSGQSNMDEPTANCVKDIRDSVFVIELRAESSAGALNVFTDTTSGVVANTPSCPTAAGELVSYSLQQASYEMVVGPQGVYDIMQTVQGVTLRTRVQNTTDTAQLFAGPLHTFQGTLGALLAPGATSAPVGVSVTLVPIQHVNVTDPVALTINPGVLTVRTDHVA